MTLVGQDQFLRNLLNVIRINRESKTQDYGMRVMTHAIEGRLTMLTPVCYENSDLSAGLSGNGIHHICGDKASINRVRYALDREAALEPYPRLLREVQARLGELHERIVTTYEIDVKFLDGWKRQQHPSWGSHDEQSAKDSAWMITRITGQVTRVVKVETIQTEEIIDG